MNRFTESPAAYDGGRAFLRISLYLKILCQKRLRPSFTLDYDVSGIITGGTFIGTGASGMAQNFINSEQGVVAVQVGNCVANSQITLTDANGKMVISYTPTLDFAVVILSSHDIVQGETYTVTVGTQSGSVQAS